MGSIVEEKLVDDANVDDLNVDPIRGCENLEEVSKEGTQTGKEEISHMIVPITAEDIQNREFSSVDEFYDLYTKYAKCVGFGVRKGDVHRDDNGNMTSRRFFCKCAGRREAKYYVKTDRKRDTKPETRTNCNAKLSVYHDKRTFTWKVRKLVEEHNHELTPLVFVHPIPNHRRIKNSDNPQISSMGSIAEEKLVDDENVDDLNVEPITGCENAEEVSKEGTQTCNKEISHMIAPITAKDILNREFSSVDEFYDLYTKYAKCVGFGVRKGDVHRDDYGNMTSRRFFCKCAGQREAKYYAKTDKKRDSKPETRTNCIAKLSVYHDKRTFTWKVRKLVEEHNHELTPLVFVHPLPNHRQIRDTDKAQINSMDKSEIPTSQIVEYIGGQADGYRGLGFSKNGLCNYNDKSKHANIVDGDANAAISYLQGKVDAQPMTVAKYSATDDGKLGNLFWADGLSRAEYQYFGDVVAFDATYKKNKYNRPLVIISGTNHHRQACIFGFGLLADECAGTYKWLLVNFLEVMMGKEPNVVVIDGDSAMREAIKSVFPNSTHRLCGWHLQKNVTTNIKDSGFYEVFKSCIYENYDIEDFEKIWRENVERFGLEDNEWVKKVYETKELWATAYLQDKFCAGFKTSSRCGAINSLIERFMQSRHSIFELVQNLERAVSVYRNNELESQFKSIYGEPVLTSGLESIERSAANVYTREIFQDVQKQIEGVSSLFVISTESIGTTIVFKVTKYGKPECEYIVLFDKILEKYECKCQMWNSYGIPCSHLFCVMKQQHVLELPETLILKRWCKDVKSYEQVSNLGEDDNEKAFLLRYGALSTASQWMSFLGAKRMSLFQETMGQICNISSNLEHECGIGNSAKPVVKTRKVDDPVFAKTKGAPASSQDVGKKHCSSSCSLFGHRKRACPRVMSGKDLSDEDEYDLPTDSNAEHQSNVASNVEGGAVVGRQRRGS